MKLIRCVNGHFYDQGKYTSCPHCAGEAATEQSITTVVTEETGYGTGSSGIAVPDDDHTVAFYNDIFHSVSADAASAGASDDPAPGNRVDPPCVGWLIALGGVHIGQDFRLKAGKNYIGRSPQMDVALTGDKSVSRHRHAIMIYEPKQRLYLIQPGESSGLAYRNNEVVLGPVKLEAYDRITVGEVNLLFMPLCGSNFDWSELLDEISGKNR